MNRRCYSVSLIVSLTIAGTMSGSSAAQTQTYSLTTLVSFNGGNGADPYSGPTLDGNGNLYGTTDEGGTNTQGTVFEIAKGTNTVTTLVNLNGTIGSNPDGGIILDRNGDLYGTTAGGGASGVGVVFEIAAGTNTFTTLATFTGAANGAFPVGNLTLDSHGNLYGTTLYGGTSGDGTVFELAAGASTIIPVVTFNGTNGQNPNKGLALDSSGNLYGNTVGGGTSGGGTIFKIAAGTNTLTTIATFNGTNGLNPEGTVTLDSSGDLYGTTFMGGADNDGTVFEIAAGTNTLNTLATFTGTSNGANPYGNLTLDGNGNLYGTTYGGGAGGDGTVFEISSATNELNTIATFNSANGREPVAGLTFDSNGNIYGTTEKGGTSDDGTVFELTPTGASDAPEPGALALLLPAAITMVTGLRRRCRFAR